MKKRAGQVTYNTVVQENLEELEKAANLIEESYIEYSILRKNSAKLR